MKFGFEYFVKVYRVKATCAQWMRRAHWVKWRPTWWRRYEASPTGYVLSWQLTQMGVACEVIAPSLIPTKAGDRVKTDRRDAEKLVRCYRVGELTPVWVPDADHEALRLRKRFTTLTARDKETNVVAIAIARELLGFMWAIAVHTEAQHKQAKAA